MIRISNKSIVVLFAVVVGTVSARIGTDSSNVLRELQQGECVAEGSSCNLLTSCCEGLFCAGTCQALPGTDPRLPRFCTQQGGFCVFSSDCCEGLVCDGKNSCFAAPPVPDDGNDDGGESPPEDDPQTPPQKPPPPSGSGAQRISPKCIQRVGNVCGCDLPRRRKLGCIRSTAAEIKGCKAPTGPKKAKKQAKAIFDVLAIKCGI